MIYEHIIYSTHVTYSIYPYLLIWALQTFVTWLGSRAQLPLTSFLYVVVAAVVVAVVVVAVVVVAAVVVAVVVVAAVVVAAVVVAAKDIAGGYCQNRGRGRRGGRASG